MIPAVLACLSVWLVAQALGLAALPITRRILRCLPDQGYAFGKAVGLLLVAYLLWLGASARLFVNDLGGVWLAFFSVAAVAAWLALRGGWQAAQSSLRAFWRAERAQIITVEILFLLALLGWTLLRAYAPSKIVSAYGEKYMEIAFLNGILRSPYFPPLDPWLSGYAISYYYFGYVMMAAVTRLAGLAPTVGFDLYDALLFALSACAAYGTVSNLVMASRGSRRASIGFGLLGALFTVGMGNLEGLLHGLYSARLLPASFLAWIDIPKLATDPQSGSFYPGHDFYSWWWWRASRVINDLDLLGNPTGLEPITEFPFFSFLLGDNHPHKLALPFVLLAIGLALNLFLRQTAAGPNNPPAAWAYLRQGGLRAAWELRRSLAFYLFYALALGALAFLNTWDFPIYLLLTLLAYAAGRALAADGLTRVAWIATVWLGAALAAASVGLYLFFYLGFSSQAGGFLPYVFPPTRLPQYLVMFGPFALILACFLPGVLWTSGRGAALRRAGQVWLWLAAGLHGAYLLFLAVSAALLQSGRLLEGGFASPELQRWTAGLAPLDVLGRVLAARLNNPWLFLFLSALSAATLAALILRLRPSVAPALPPAALFAVLLALVGLALTLSVEFVYLRDLFGARMNTVFKFYFQGWVLMACASAYACWWLLSSAGWPPAPRAAFALAVSALAAAGLVYTFMGIYSRTHGFAYPPEIDAGATVAGRYPGHWNSYPDDWAAIQWLRAREGDAPTGSPPVLLEASAGSYNHAGRFSAFTGFPTVLGWDYHEYQWRGSNEEQARRLADIQVIYTTPNPDLALNLLRHWQVRYLILGDTERHWVESLCRRPEQPCDSRRAIEKFNRFLIPLFTQGGTTLYAVP